MISYFLKFESESALLSSEAEQLDMNYLLPSTLINFLKHLIEIKA